MNNVRQPTANPNPNLVWSQIFVGELVRCGVQDVCIAPGSRSTPLAFAFYANPDIRIHRHLDERSAAFFALGMALERDRPIALLCTSGTAGANFFPAVVEANMSQVPLLVLTADRPYELRHSGANQTIDQIKVFGDHVLWSVDMALPQVDAPDIALRNLRTVAARAVAKANGLRKGPVHLNFPFRKPLEPPPDEEWLTTGSDEKSGGWPFTQIMLGSLAPTAEAVSWLSDLISEEQKGIIVCGPRCPGGDFPEIVAELASKIGFPILADPLSGVRFGPHVEYAPVCGAYETFLHPQMQVPYPRVVLRFGALPTSQRLNSYLARCGAASHIHVRENGVWADDNHNTTHFLQLSESALCSELLAQVAPATDSSWLEDWLRIESDCWSIIEKELEDTHFDGEYAYFLVNQLPQGSIILAGNSLPIRHVDQFGRPSKKPLHVYANRGASGIDGNISTGLGLAAAGDDPVTIMVGDITFYHDSNGLLALQHLGNKTITLLVMNNDGGGIFQRLPVAQFEPPFEQLFKTPHGLEPASIAATYDLPYAYLKSPIDLKSAYPADATEARTQLLEVRTNAKQDYEMRATLENRVFAQLLKQ